MTKRSVSTESQNEEPVPTEIKRIGISPDDPMSEGGRKALSFFFAQMREAETQVREGGHKDAIHDMRVATRRLRSTMEIFEPFYRSRTLKPFQKWSRNVGRELGATRDLEVVKAKVEKQAAKMDATILEAMQPVISGWDADFANHFAVLMQTLDKPDYQAMLTDLAEFLSTPLEGSIALKEEKPEPHFVRHAVPLLIAQRYAELRAYEPVLKAASLDTLHELRIAVKQLRYMVEIAADVLSPQAKLVIDEAKAFQDHLGSLQDERVIVELVHGYVSRAGEQEPLSGVLKFLASREEEKLRLWNAVPQKWDKFTRQEVKQALALSVAEL
jgi:CHAD domain-containing protein